MPRLFVRMQIGGAQNMPNYCDNRIAVSHQNANMMKRFNDALTRGCLFEEFLPLDSNDPSEYWGTKWDAQNGSFWLNDDKLSGHCRFETAWTPPIKVYEKLAQLGFKIEATYYEEGLQFAGSWTNDFGDEYFEFEFENKKWRKKITNSRVLEVLEEAYEVWLADQE